MFERISLHLNSNSIQTMQHIFSLLLASLSTTTHTCNRSFVCWPRSLKYVCTTIIFMQSHISLISHFIFSTKIFMTTRFIITTFMRIKSPFECTKYYVRSIQYTQRDTHTHIAHHLIALKQKRKK